MTTYDVNIIVNGEDRASGPLSGVGSALGNMATIAGGILASQVFTKIASGVVDFAKDVFASASESQNAIADLNATLQSTKGAAGVTSQAAQDLASNLQKVTMFGDETILSGESMLLTFTNIGKDVFPQATEAMLNMATKMKTDPTQAAIMLGKALNDPIAGVGALRRVGVQLTDEQEKQIKSFMAVGDVASAQKIILGELSTEFGGLAQAMGKTAAGKIEIFKNKIDDLKEKLGDKLLADGGGLSKIMDIANNMIDSPGFAIFVNNIATGINDLVVNVAKGVDTIVKMKGSISEFANSPATKKITAGLKNIFGILTQPAIKDAAQRIFGGIKTFLQDLGAKVLPWAMTMFDKLSSWFVANGPLIGKYVQLIADNFNNYFLPALMTLWNVAAPLLSGILDLILGLARMTMQIATGDWAGAWETFKVVIYGVADSIGQALHNLFNGIAGMMGTSMSQIGATWSSNWNQFKLIFYNIWMQISTTWSANWNQFKLIFFTVMSQIGATWSANWNQFKTILSTVWTNIVSDVQNKTSEILSSMEGWLADMIGSITAGIDEFGQAGADMIAGFEQGIKAAWVTLMETFTGLIALLPSAVKKILGIKSPSTVFAKIGSHMMDGLAQGIKKGAKMPQVALDATLNGFTGSQDKSARSYQNNSTDASYRQYAPVYVTVNSQGGDVMETLKGLRSR